MRSSSPTDASGRLVLLATAAEDFDFAHPTASLTINVGGGRLTIQGTVNLGAANLTVNDARSIIVTGALSGGTIVLNATRAATIAAGASITASGDLTIAVSASISPTWSTTTPFFRDIDAAGQLTVGAATLQATNITLTVDATTRKFGEFELDELRLREDPLNSSSRPSSRAMAEGTLVTFVDGGADPRHDHRVTTAAGSTTGSSPTPRSA